MNQQQSKQEKLCLNKGEGDYLREPAHQITDKEIRLDRTGGGEDVDRPAIIDRCHLSIIPASVRLGKEDHNSGLTRRQKLTALGERETEKNRNKTSKQTKKKIPPSFTIHMVQRF